MKFAANTKVPANRSRVEIEELVYKYAGRDTNFSYGQMKGMAVIAFIANDRRVKFTLPLPTEEEAAIGAKPKRALQEPSATMIQAWRDKEERRRWRSLLLSIKGKLETVETGIHTFEQEFLSHIVPEGSDMTIYERMMAGPEHKLLAPLPSTEKSTRKSNDRPNR